MHVNQNVAQAAVRSQFNNQQDPSQSFFDYKGVPTKDYSTVYPQRNSEQCAPTTYTVQPPCLNRSATNNPQVQIKQTKTYQVGKVIELLALSGDAIQSDIVTPFHSQTAPEISVLWYFVSLTVNSGLQDEQAMAALVLIERLCQTMNKQGTPMVINSLTVHRLILVTMLMLSKFYNDIFFANHHIASVGGVPVEELNALEKYYFEKIDYSLFIQPEEYERYEKALEVHVQEIEALAAMQVVAQQQQMQLQQQSQSTMFAATMQSSCQPHYPAMDPNQVSRPNVFFKEQATPSNQSMSNSISQVSTSSNSPDPAKNPSSYMQMSGMSPHASCEDSFFSSFSASQPIMHQQVQQPQYASTVYQGPSPSPAAYTSFTQEQVQATQHRNSL